MRRIDDYQHNARQCRELARSMPPAHRDQLLDMARQWEQLAAERAAEIEGGTAPADLPPLRG